MKIDIKVLDHAKDLPLPNYATNGSAGFDLMAAIEADQSIILAPGKRCLVPTGIALGLTQGLEAQVRSRSGLALKNGVFVLNSPGTIDADYRGEVNVILANAGNEPFTISRGMRIAQMVIASYQQVDFNVVEDLSITERGIGGFGSTGI